jgi:uncharacterized membrane protein
MEPVTPSPAPPVPRWLIPVRALLAVAIVGAGYLALVSISGGPVAGCGPGSGCDKVLQSRWAYWMNTPVSLPALAVYLALWGSLALWEKKRTSPDDERGAWAAIIALSIVVAGAAFWFIGLQAFVIKAFCKFCMTAHACGLLAAALCLKNIPVAKEPGTPMWTTGSGKRGVPGSGILLVSVLGLLGVGLLAGGQMLVQKQRNFVKVFPPGGTNQIQRGHPLSTAGTNAARTAGTAQATNLPPYPNAKLIGPRLLSLYGGRYLLRLDAVPMMGSPDATNVIVDLVDYTCPHCRELHFILSEAQRVFSNQLGVVVLPMPMSTNCNTLLPKNMPSHSNACELVRLSLAVWRAKPTAFREFEDWMFTPPTTPTFEQARDHAGQLVGVEALEFASKDPWIEEQMFIDCQLHMSNWQATGRALMPQVIMGDVVSVGEINNVPHLLKLLDRYFGLSLPEGP